MRNSLRSIVQRNSLTRARSFSQAHPPASQPTHQIIEIVHGAKTETPKTVGPSVAGGAIGQQTGAASADGKYLYTLNDFYDGTAVTARVEQHSMADGSLVGVYPLPAVPFVEW